MNAKTFKFRIIEKCHPHLNYDTEVITKDYSYYLYVKVPWYLGSWKLIYPSPYWKSPFGELDYFISVEDAKEKAHDYVKNFILEQKENEIYKKHKKELKVTTEIALEFQIDS